MRRRALLLVVLAACGDDPTLHVDVTHPAGLDIASTTVTVYESSALACDGVKFGDLDDAQLAALTVAEETVLANGTTIGELTGLSRTDNKVIVARGFDDAGVLAAANCVEVGLVEGNDEVAIATDQAVDVQIGMVDPDVDPLGVGVSTTDASGNGVDGREVSWTVFGPAGTAPYDSPASFTIVGDAEWRPTAEQCTASGNTRIHPMPPDKIGGYAVQIRVAWARQPAPLFSTMSAIDVKNVTALAVNGATHFCAPHVSGAQHRLACIDGSAVKDFSATVANGSVTLAVAQTQNLGTAPVAVYAVPDGADRHVYAVDGHGAITALFEAQGGGTPTVCTGITTCVDDAIAMPACGSAPARLVMHRTGVVVPTRDIALADATTGANLVSFARAGGQDSRLVGGGCVTEIGATPGQRQLFAVDTGKQLLGSLVVAETHASHDCTAAGCADLPLFAGAGVGFSGGATPEMITTTVDATGVLLAHVEVASARDGTLRFVERSKVASASIPNHITTGTLDADTLDDTLWDITSKRGTSFEVGYGKTIAKDPLEALSNPLPATVDDLFAIDLSGDGIDDLVITGALGDTSLTGVVVVPLNAAPPEMSPTVDPGSCP